MSRTKDSIKLEMLYMLFADRVRKAAYFVVRDNDIANEVLQETFLVAAEKLSQVKDTDKTEAWLIRIAINRARNTFRHRNKLVSLTTTPVASNEKVEDLILKNEEVEALRVAVSNLPEDFQVVLFLKYSNGMSIKDIASALDIAEGTVKSRLYRAREKLREGLQNATPKRKRHSYDHIQRG